jgi:multiple sugar transport system permease protein
MRSAFRSANALATHRSPRRLRGDLRIEFGVRGEAPRAVDDDPDCEPELAVDHRGLQLSVAQLNERGGDAVHPQICVALAAGDRAMTFNVLVRFRRTLARLRRVAVPYALLAPSLFGVVVFLLLPMLVVLWLSLYRWDLLGPLEYVGLANWHSVLVDSSFGKSLAVTALFIALVVPVQTVLGLFAALMLARNLPGSGFFRTLYVLPWICSPLAVAVLWRWILAPTDGAVSTVLGRQVEWLTDPQLALPVVSAVTVWTNAGYVTLFFLAGILAVPRELLDAASTDGAGTFQRFRRITLPLLRPTLFFVLVTGIISAAQVFDTVYALTGGGPMGRTDVLAHRIYAEAFGAAAVGRAAVMAVIMFALLVGVTLVQQRYFRRRISYDLV